MKSSLMIILILTTAVSNSFFAQPLTSQQKESAQNTAVQNEVRKVIELETEYYYEGNFEKWASTWSNEGSNYIIIAGPNGNSVTIGWENISAANKSKLKNTPLIAPDEFNNYSKFDYRYDIDGNHASVNLKEGKGNFQVINLQKQNGAWKITGKTFLNSVAYKLRSDFAALKRLIGEWKIDPMTYKRTPEDNKYESADYRVNVRENMYGIEFVINDSWLYAGRPFAQPTITENFIPDYGSNVIRYFLFQKSNTGIVTPGTGIALFDSSGNFIIKANHPDKPNVLLFDNTYVPKEDGVLHFQGRMYDLEGKVSFSWSFDLRRI